MSSIHPLWQRSGRDPLFEHLKSSEYKQDVRTYFEQLFDNLNANNLIDRNFVNDFGNQLSQRWWELFIGNYLVHQTLRDLSVHSRGPDFSFSKGQTRFWVECTVPWPSNPEQSSRESRPKRQVLTLNHDNFTSMVTSAVRNKNAKLYCDRRKGVVGEKDGIILAVSDLAGPNRSRICDKIWAKKGPSYGTEEVHTRGDHPASSYG